VKVSCFKHFLQFDFLITDDPFDQIVVLLIDTMQVHQQMLFLSKSGQKVSKVHLRDMPVARLKNY
jgi:hypothetical protein